MTERDTRDVEERLRGVVDGPKPMAPDSLHRFLREIPQAQTDRRRGSLGRLFGLLLEVPLPSASSPYARRARLAISVAAAIIVGVSGGALLLSIRQNQTPMAAPAVESTDSSGPWVTPRASLSTHQPPVQASFMPKLSDLICEGLPEVGNEGMALPTSAVVVQGGYLGVTGGDYGLTGLVHSGDGLYWDWAPPETVGPDASILTSISSNQVDTIILAGAVQGVDGTEDGRIWTSYDQGVTWNEIPDESPFRGTTVRLVVYSSGQYVALGWNDASAADSIRQVAEWRSTDGVTWTHVTAPIKGTAALLLATAAGFVLSGTPLSTGAIDEPPIWFSADGATWTRSTASDNTAQLMNPLTSATVTAASGVYAVSSAPNDTMGHRLVFSPDGGQTWSSIKVGDSMPYASSISSVASLNTGSSMPGYVGILFATTDSTEGARVWGSEDGGVSWMEIQDANVGGPSGTTLLQLGNGYLAGNTSVLSYGVPDAGIGTGTGVGVWIMSLASATK
jgi:hypothetical protein